MIEINNFNNICIDGYDEVWAIVRSYKNYNPNSEILWIPELSPSKNLFSKYLKLKDTNKWNTESFNNIYVPQFLKEMKTNIVARNKLNELSRKDKQNKNICLICFCLDETLCHRSIIAGLLQGVNRNVIGPNYSKYYDLYKQI